MERSHSEPSCNTLSLSHMDPYFLLPSCDNCMWFHWVKSDKCCKEPKYFPLSDYLSSKYLCDKLRLVSCHIKLITSGPFWSYFWKILKFSFWLCIFLFYVSYAFLFFSGFALSSLSRFHPVSFVVIHICLSLFNSTMLVRSSVFRPQYLFYSPLVQSLFVFKLLY